MGVPGIEEKPRRALVLSGGGSKGAFEVGVLQRLMGDEQLDYDLLCGTSVGAINAAFLASTAEDPAAGARRLVDQWRSLALESIYDLSLREVLRAGRLLLGGQPPRPEPGALHRGGLLNTSGLERQVVRAIPWRRISQNIAARRVEALSVSATHVGSGKTVVFVERHGGGLPEWSRDPAVRASEALVGPFHVLASAAIPVLFPAVSVDGHWFCDGGLRQNTPLAPAIRLGADRVLVVSLKHIATPLEEAAEAATNIEAYPSPWFIFGKSLNALLLDHTDYDLDRLRRTNTMVESGIRAFGDRFLDELNRVMMSARGQEVRYVAPFQLRPSEDIGKIAGVHARSQRLRELPGLTGSLIKYLTGAPGREADLLSYLLFDGAYAGELIELGHRDARAREEELVAFFEDRRKLAAIV